MSQRRVLTVLFTDLVGSTELSQQIGDDAAQELWRTHFALLREALAANGGDEVKNVGDGVMAVFASPSDAVSCAIAMQQSVDRENRRGDNPLGLRVGMQVGELIPEDGDYYGIAVVVAERLCKRAVGGQILTTELQVAVTGARIASRYRGVGLLELKGISEPVATVEVVWEPVPVMTVPLPDALSPVDASPFVGRDEDLDKLREAYRRALGGTREIAFVVGEPGIGKSRLAAELAREGYAEGATVLYGRCDEIVTPYQPFVEALHYLVRNVPLGELRDHIGTEGAELIPMIPELQRRIPHLSPPLPSGDPESARQRLFGALTGVLSRAARDRLIILVLDDLHWADHGTIQLLRHVLRAEAFPLLLLVTYRGTDLDPQHPLSALLADLHRQHQFVRLHLDGLEVLDIACAIEERAGYPTGNAGRALAETLHSVTDGNPFFIEQVLGDLIESGAIVRPDGRWRFDVAQTELGIPEGVKDLIGRRLSRVSDACNDVLVAAAAVGAESHIDVLQDVAGIPLDVALDAVEEAATARFLIELPEDVGRFRFAHTLVRDAIYEGLGRTRRAQLHARIADALEAREDDIGPIDAQIAHHLLASMPTGSKRGVVGRKAADHARRAAEYATQILSHDEAASAYETALRALGMVEEVDEAERCELFLGLGRAQTTAHLIEEAVSTLEEAVQIAANVADRLLFARVAVAFSLAIRTSSKRDSGVEIPLLESALDRLGLEDSPERADVLVVFAERLGPFGSDPERASALARKGLEIATRLGDDRRIMWLRDVLVMNLGSHPVHEQRAIAEQNVALAEKLADVPWQLRTRLRLIAAELAVGEVDLVDEQLPTVQALAELTREPHQIVQSRWWPIVRLVMEGKWESAEALARELIEIADQHQLPHVAWPGLLFIMRRVQGRLSEIEPLVRAATRRSPMTWWKAGLALAFCEQGRVDEARELIDEVVASDLDDVPRDWMWSMLLGLLGECAHRFRDEKLASLAYEHLLPYRHENIHAGGFYSGSAAVILGLCAATCDRSDVAVEHFEEAEELDQRSRAWPWLAISQLEHAAVLETRRGPGDEERARVLLSASLPKLEELGISRYVPGGLSRLGPLSE